MKLTDHQLELAAVSAETFKADADGLCVEYFVTPNGTFWPACAAVEFDGEDVQAREDDDCSYMVAMLSSIWRWSPNGYHTHYTTEIDTGNGAEVAAAFRAAKETAYEDCPNCPNQGWYYIGIHGEQEQCEWCNDNPNSKFRAAKT